MAPPSAPAAGSQESSEGEAVRTRAPDGSRRLRAIAAADDDWADDGAVPGMRSAAFAAAERRRRSQRAFFQCAVCSGRDVARDDDAAAAGVVRIVQSAAAEPTQLLVVYGALSKCSALAALPRADVERVIRQGMQRVQLRAGAVVCREGAAGRYLFVVESGRVMLSQERAKDRASTVCSEIGPGATIGETAILHQEPRHVTATCLEDSTLWTLSRRRFRALAKASHARQLNQLVNHLRDEPRLSAVAKRDLIPVAAACVHKAAAPGDECVPRHCVGYLLAGSLVRACGGGSPVLEAPTDGTAWAPFGFDVLRPLETAIEMRNAASPNLEPVTAEQLARRPAGEHGRLNDNGDGSDGEDQIYGDAADTMCADVTGVDAFRFGTDEALVAGPNGAKVCYLTSKGLCSIVGSPLQLADAESHACRSKRFEQVTPLHALDLRPRMARELAAAFRVVTIPPNTRVAAAEESTEWDPDGAGTFVVHAGTCTCASDAVDDKAICVGGWFGGPFRLCDSASPMTWTSGPGGCTLHHLSQASLEATLGAKGDVRAVFERAAAAEPATRQGSPEKAPRPPNPNTKKQRRNSIQRIWDMITAAPPSPTPSPTPSSRSLGAQMRELGDGPVDHATPATKRALAASAVAFKRLEPIRMLACGSTAFVRLMRDNATGTCYAVKCFGRRSVAEKQMGAKLRDEISVLQKVAGHPFIVGFHGVHFDSDWVYLVMDLVTGGDMRDIVGLYHLQRARDFASKGDKNVRFTVRLREALAKPIVEIDDEGCPSDLAMAYSVSLIDAVAYLHRNGVIHRDIKPENIMLARGGMMKLVDFGLSRFVPDGSLCYTFCGTSHYMAPELILSVGYDTMADWWSVGCVIFEFIMGRRLNDADGDDDAIEATTRLWRLDEAPGVLMDAHIEESARALLLEIMQPKPAKRFQNTPMRDIRAHSTLRRVDWTALRTKSSYSYDILRENLDRGAPEADEDYCGSFRYQAQACQDWEDFEGRILVAYRGGRANAAQEAPNGGSRTTGSRASLTKPMRRGSGGGTDAGVVTLPDQYTLEDWMDWDMPVRAPAPAQHRQSSSGSLFGRDGASNASNGGGASMPMRASVFGSVVGTSRHGKHDPPPPASAMSALPDDLCAQLVTRAPVALTAPSAPPASPGRRGDPPSL